MWWDRIASEGHLILGQWGIKGDWGWGAPLKKLKIVLQIVLIFSCENRYKTCCLWNLLVFHAALSALPGTKFLALGGYLLYNALFDLVIWHRFAQTNVILAFSAVVVYVNFEETGDPLMSSDLISFRPLEHSSIKNLWDWWMLWESD